MSGLQGKVAWITGAGTGIGLAGAMALAEAGAAIVLSGRRAEVLKDAAAAIAAKGFKAEAKALDVADSGAVRRAADEILAHHGRIDILVASAGLNIPKRAWSEVEVSGFDEVVNVNLNGNFYAIHAVLPAMRRQKDGLIVNVSSWAGRFVTGLTGPAYNAAKHATVAMTLSLNMEECRNGIRACAICPGEVATPIMEKRPVRPSAEELARMLQPDDLGRTIRFVAEMPPHVCVNEILISPTWNRTFLGGADLAPR